MTKGLTSAMALALPFSNDQLIDFGLQSRTYQTIIIIILGSSLPPPLPLIELSQERATGIPPKALLITTSNIPTIWC